MAQVSVRVNGRPFKIACDDGQEERLMELGDLVDRRVKEVMAAVGADVGEQRLLVMASLLIADELDHVQSQVADLQAGPDHRAIERARELEEEELSSTLEQMASRIEAIAEKLEAV